MYFMCAKVLIILVTTNKLTLFWLQGILFEKSFDKARFFFILFHSFRLSDVFIAIFLYIKYSNRQFI